MKQKGSNFATGKKVDSVGGGNSKIAIIGICSGQQVLKRAPHSIRGAFTCLRLGK